LLKKERLLNEGAIYGIVGVLKVFNVNYIAVINGISKVGHINRADINKVT
jgi:hypothetical protein